MIFKEYCHNTHCLLSKCVFVNVIQHMLEESLSFREFEALYQDHEHVQIAHKAAQEASQRAMNNPRRFARPSILSALATAMVPTLSVAIR